MALSPDEIKKVKHWVPRAWLLDKRGLRQLAAGVRELADEVEAGREVIAIAARIRDDGYTPALAKRLAGALRALRADAFVWREGDVTFHKEPPK